MSDNESTPPPPAPDPSPPAERPAADAGIRGELDALRSDVDDALALAHSAVQMQLEDDDEAAPPEETTVEPRGGEAPPAAAPAATASGDKHSGLFI